MAQQAKLWTLGMFGRGLQPLTWLAMLILFVCGFWLTDVRGGWMFTVALFYIAIPYALLIRNPGELVWLWPTGSKLERWAFVLALNSPFWLYFASYADAGAVYMMLAMILVAIARSAKWIRLATLPGIDVLSAAFCAVAPFAFAVMLADAGIFGWVPAWIIMVLWALASALMGQLGRNAMQNHTETMLVHKLGTEKALAILLGLYAVMAVLPIVYYGQFGLLTTLVMALYLLRISELLPVRGHPYSFHFVRVWQGVRSLNVTSVLVVIIYTICTASML